MKKYIVIAGVNGAGKSTLYQTIDSLKMMKRINTDEIVKSFGNWKNTEDVIKAGKMAVTLINEYFEKGYTFNQETTLCGNSILNNIKRAKELGYTVEMHYVGLESDDIAKKRIIHRVENGGHGIPDADVERRYIESFMKLKKAINMCDFVVLYDNSEAFRRFGFYKRGELKVSNQFVPNWFIKYVK